jgi:N-acetylneuraminate synthase
MIDMKRELLQAILGKEDKDIVIIGKGPSVDSIYTELLSDFIVVNVNDSEVIFPGDISVFHSGWVLDRFDHHSPKAKLYITDREFLYGPQYIKAKYIPNTPETADFLIERFFEESMSIEQSIVASALKYANHISSFLGQRKRVYLVGFDFSLKEGFSKKIIDPKHGLENEYIEQVINIQEKVLENIIAQRDRLSIDIFHVGNKPYSFYSVDAFNGIIKSQEVSNEVEFQNSTSIKDQVIIVAEITTNHFGDWQRLEAMIRAAKSSGANYIKLQKRDVDSFYTKEQLSKPYTSPFGKTFGDYRHGIELNEAQIFKVRELCNQLNIGWFMSILDKPSYDYMKKFEPTLIKLPSTISEKKDYLRAVAEDFEGELVISTGFTDASYEEFIFQTFKKAKKIYLLQCTSAYPTPMEHTQIGVIRHYYNLSRKEARIIPGFSSHDIGSVCSMMAVAAGAKMIEKHVKYGDVAWSHFDQVAINLANDDFKNFVQDIRKAERIVGEETKVIHTSEHHKY